MPFLEVFDFTLAVVKSFHAVLTAVANSGEPVAFGRLLVGFWPALSPLPNQIVNSKAI